VCERECKGCSGAVDRRNLLVSIGYKRGSYMDFFSFAEYLYLSSSAGAQGAL